MPNGFFEIYIALSACVIAFCLWNKTLNKTTVIHVVALSFLGGWYMITPSLKNLIPLSFSSQLYNFLLDLAVVATMSCFYMYLFRKKLAKRKRNILYLSLLVMSMMPLTLAVTVLVMFTFNPPG